MSDSPKQSNPRGPALWLPVQLLALAAVIALGLALRLRGLAQVPWYPDEGLVAELAASLCRGWVPSASGFVQNGFLPLASSRVAPALAALAIKATGCEPMAAVRAVAMLCGALTCVGLWLVGRQLRRPLLGLAAALAFACLPLAVALGQMGFYHHVGAMLAVFAALLLLKYLRNRSLGLFLGLCLVSGLAVASAYWLLWIVALPLAAALHRKRPAHLAPGLALMALPMALAMLDSWACQRASFWMDLRAIASMNGGGGDMPAWLRRIAPVYGLWVSGLAYPQLWAGFAGLLLAAWQWRQDEDPRRPGLWLLAFGAAAAFETLRQRPNLQGFCYPLIVALPWVAMGWACAAAAAVGAWRAGGWRRAAGAVLALAVLATAFKPMDLAFLRQASAKPDKARQLLAELKARGRQGDLVIGQQSINWALPALGLRPTEWDMVLCWAGEEGHFLRPGQPRERFLYPPELDKARFMVVSAYTHGFSFLKPAALDLGLRAERQGWTLLWENGEYQLYGNPAQGFAKPKFAARILAYYNLYDQAAMRAMERRDWESAYFALSQGVAYSEGDVAGRRQALARAAEELVKARRNH